MIEHLRSAHANGRETVIGYRRADHMVDHRWKADELVCQCFPSVELDAEDIGESAV